MNKAKELKEALLNMCFCKRYICKRCGYVEEIPDRCKNEQIRDKIFHKLSKDEQSSHRQHKAGNK